MEISALYKIFTDTCHGIITTDTRKITQGSLFVALRGDTWNGNNFALEALDHGCGAALVDDVNLKNENNCYYVENVERTLQELANYHRKQFNIPVVGLTGSNGKTTTKELIARVLGTEKSIVATEGNLNNHLGVPMILLRITSETEIAIIEMGANHVGEIALLCEIAEPTHGLITNIGKAHIGLFGGYENIIKGKTELYDYLRKNSGEVFVWGDDSLLMEKSIGITRTVFGKNVTDEYKMTSKFSTPNLELVWNSREIKTQLVGEYNLGNVQAAIAIGKYFEINNDAICDAIGSYVSDNLRSEVTETADGSLIIKDYYNANPSSMELAIQNAQKISGKKELVLILGDMFELGEYSLDEHGKILEQAIQTKATQIYVVGNDFAKVAQVYSESETGRVFSFQSTDEAVNILKEITFFSKTILLKGSRGMKFEKIFDVIHS
jgi:UDP-N-acetylmuramoyl-tripeptide--D-alanyl-D-alanine ligase